MATVHKSIALTDQQDDRIKEQIDAGRHTNDCEYIRDLIRREQERSAELGVIRAALMEGEARENPSLSTPGHSSRECWQGMAEYRLTPAAKQDLAAIWVYTSRR